MLLMHIYKTGACEIACVHLCLDFSVVVFVVILRYTIPYTDSPSIELLYHFQ